MKQNQASRTAEYMALFRALESFRPANTRLFEDRFAREFLRPSLRAVAHLSRVHLFGALIPWIIDQHWPGARSSGIARTRFIDEALVKAIEAGIEQVVILGAGFDCRAYRIRGVERARLFEVDHPDTLAAKREHLRRVLHGLPPHVVFAEIDFNQQQLKDVLIASGFDSARRTFFVWEGVTNYLSEQAVDATLRFISTAAAGSRLIFTYVHRGVLDHSAEFEGTGNLMRLLRKADEPWTFGLYPAELQAYLETRSFELAEDIGSVEYRARYMNPHGKHEKGYEFYRIALACVVRRAGSADETCRRDKEYTNSRPTPAAARSACG
jgi:methyltransferase (TIGR00027 family)